MSTVGTLLNGALSIVALAYPPAAPAILIAQRLEPFAEAGIPLIKAALQQGPDAFQAAKQAAPDLFAELENLATNVKKAIGGKKAGTASDIEVAQLAAHIVGVDPPGWAHEDTQRWWDRQGAGTQS